MSERAIENPWAKDAPKVAERMADTPAVVGVPTAAPQYGRLCSLEDARHHLGVGRSLVKRLLATGEVRSVKVGSRRLIPIAELDRFIAERLDGGKT
jgi:excisionase family DNA binding protein